MALVSLVDLVKAVREQLYLTREAGREDSLKFDVPSVVIEAEVQATKTITVGAQVEAGVEIKVLKFGASGSIEAGTETASTAKVSITLTPHDETTFDHKLKVGRKVE